jgi:hypothetical protein
VSVERELEGETAPLELELEWNEQQGTIESCRDRGTDCTYQSRKLANDELLPSHNHTIGDEVSRHKPW